MVKIVDLWTCFLVSSFFHVVQAKRILCLSTQIVSHQLEVHAIGEQLLLNGHEVYTAVQSNFPEAKKEGFRRQGLKILEFSVPLDEPCFASLSMSFYKLEKPEFFAETSFQHCRRMMNDTVFKKTVKDLNFDLAIVDGFPIAPCMFILPYHLNIPYVFEFSFIPPFQIRIPALPSFQPLPFRMFDHSMNFWERLQNSQMFFSIVVMGFPYSNKYDLLEQYAPGKTWEDLIRNSLLFIGSVDHVMERPMVSMPNVVMVPGLTIRAGNPLTAEFEAIVEKSKNGVILIAFGSLTGMLPQDVMIKMLGAVAKLEQTVLFRYSAEIKDIEVPSNVIIKDWLPQQDLLAHEKTRLFITHCGNNGRHEAAYHAVPMLAIPLYGDQHHNAMMVEKMGIGLKINIHSFTAKEMITKVKRILTEKIFTQNIQRLSRIIRDRPMSPRETAVYWVEHVMKYGGEHLRSHAMDMPGYAYYMLDVLAVLLLTVLLVILILCAIVSTIKRFCLKKPKLD